MKRAKLASVVAYPRLLALPPKISLENEPN